MLPKRRSESFGKEVLREDICSREREGCEAPLARQTPSPPATNSASSGSQHRLPPDPDHAEEQVRDDGEDAQCSVKPIQRQLTCSFFFYMHTLLVTTQIARLDIARHVLTLLVARYHHQQPPQRARRHRRVTLKSGATRSIACLKTSTSRRSVAREVTRALRSGYNAIVTRRPHFGNAPVSSNWTEATNRRQYAFVAKLSRSSYVLCGWRGNEFKSKPLTLFCHLYNLLPSTPAHCYCPHGILKRTVKYETDV